MPSLLLNYHNLFLIHLMRVSLPWKYYQFLTRPAPRNLYLNLRFNKISCFWNSLYCQYSPSLHFLNEISFLRTQHSIFISVKYYVIFVSERVESIDRWMIYLTFLYYILKSVQEPMRGLPSHFSIANSNSRPILFRRSG